MEYPGNLSIIKEIREKSFLPVYILHGEESFFIDQVLEVAEREVLTESEKPFNLSVLYGREVNFKQILDHTRQFPMMSQWRVVILKEAQQLKEIENLVSYFKKPSPQTLFVLAYKGKKIDGRAKWFKEAKQNPKIGVLYSEKIRDYKLASWLSDHLRQRKVNITPDANNLLCEYLGNDLKKLLNEIEKIELNLRPGQSITVEEVDKYVGISKEFNVFELLKALGMKDVNKAFAIADNLSSNLQRNPIQMIGPAFFQFFQKVYIAKMSKQMSDGQLAGLLRVSPFFVKEYRAAANNYSFEKLQSIFQLIENVDARAKGVNNRKTPPSDLLKELVGTLLSPEHHLYSFE